MLHRISLPVQLVMMIVFTLLFGKIVPLWFMQTMYTLSLCLKEILGFLLPFIIFTFVFVGLISLKRNAPLILLLLISSIFISNGLAALIAYVVSLAVLPSLVSTVCLDGGFSCGGHVLEPFFSFSLPALIRADHALFASIVAGIVITFIPFVFFETTISRLKNSLEKFFAHIFIPCLPLYIVGFLLKIQYEGVLVVLMENYGGAFVLIVALQLTCLFVWYLVAEGFAMSKAIIAIRNALASYITAFSTMSSTATVPVSIQCAEKNTQNAALSHMAMPVMANVHLLGDALSTPILALVTMLLFYGKFPAFSLYLIFAWKFCWSMFAVAGVPAGGIVVMIPVLQAYLGFTPEMISIMMTLYILLDSFGTAANVMGDGALVILVNKMIKRLGLI